MPLTPLTCWGLAACLIGGTARGQHSPPIADQAEVSALQPGISEHGVRINGELAYLFDDPDGKAEVMHVLGDFLLTLGDGDAQTFRSREAVIWMTPGTHEGRDFHRLSVLLWRDAQIRELGGTVTVGPALFVTLATFGAVSVHADNVTFEPSIDSDAYREGQAIRLALAKSGSARPDRGAAMRVFDASGLTVAKAPGQRAAIRFDARGTFLLEEVDGRQVATVTGGAYLSRGVPGSNEYLDILADSVVVFLAPSAEPILDAPEQPEVGGDEAGGAPKQPATPGRMLGKRRRRSGAQRQLMTTGLGDMEIEAVYLEGDVRMTQGQNMIHASRLYYDFNNDRALILDAVVRTTLTDRHIPLYLRADRIRQLSMQHYVADNAVLTTSEFHTPHYHVGASRIELVDRTPMHPAGMRGPVRAGRFRIRHATLNLYNRPVLYWPYVYGTFDTPETSLRRFRVGFSDGFGTETETDWDLFNLLGLERPDGFDATLSLDYYTRRGPASGVDADYEQERYFGLLRSYLLSEDGEDRLGRARRRVSQQGSRGRFLLRHRQYLEDDWELSLELSYISDRSFLEEFFESEFDLGKDQETLIYLKRQTDNWSVSGLLQWRILDFETQTTRLPEFSFFWVGRSLGNGATWFSENRAGVVRLRGGRQTLLALLRNGPSRSSASTSRADTRQEIEYPIDIGPMRLVPFASVRGSAWTDSPTDGNVTRSFFVYGVRSSMYFSRIYPDIESELFDVHGMRHIIKPEVVAWMSHTNRDSADLFGFDQSIEEIEEIDGVSFRVRQRWQTKRGEHQNRRVVDVVTLDVGVGFFNDLLTDKTTNAFVSFSRPELSIARNHVSSSIIWRMNDRTTLLSETNYDLNDRDIDIFNLGLAVERSPRLSYLLAYRFIGDRDSNLMTFGSNYRLTEKHTLVVREQFDLDRGRTQDFTVGLIRRFPRWFAAISFELDEAEEDFGVSLAIWPEGLPQATLGSRRFTGLAGAMDMRAVGR